MTKIQNLKCLDHWKIGIWILFAICYLVLGISYTLRLDYS